MPFYASQSSLLIADKYNEIYFFADSLTKKDVKVLSLKEQLDTSTPQGRFMLTIFGAIAEFERELILQRQREGIQLAKAAGKYKGRNAKKRPKDFDFYKQAYYERTMTVTKIAKHYKVSRPTVYKWLKEKT